MFLGRTLLLRLQGYQSCAGAGMLAPGLANVVLAQHFVLGGLPDLSGHFSTFGSGLSGLESSQSSWVGTGMLAPGLANLCWRRIWCSAVWFGTLGGLGGTFGSGLGVLLEEGC